MLKAIIEAFKFSRSSDRGLLRHLAYLLEALVLLAISKANSIVHVHVHFGTNAATVAYLARMMGGPRFSMTVHGPAEFDQPYGQSLTTKLSAASFVVAISSYCKSQLFRWAPIASWQDIHVIGCSVGNEWFDAACPIDEFASGIVCVGRLDEQKGHLLLIDAFADAVNAGFGEHLTIVGDGPLRSAIEDRAVVRKIEDRVNLVGWQDAVEIRKHLLAAKALVLASFAEGLPVVIMEAMALRCPVLATKIAGIPELVRDGLDGWLVTAGDRAELADAITLLGQITVARLNEMGELAQQQVRVGHFIASVVRQLDEVLRFHHDPKNKSLVLDKLSSA